MYGQILQENLSISANPEPNHKIQNNQTMYKKKNLNEFSIFYLKLLVPPQTTANYKHICIGNYNIQSISMEMLKSNGFIEHISNKNCPDLLFRWFMKNMR